MSSEKKITKEDTWRSEELRRHIQGQDEENRRRERSKREETHQKQRSAESTDRRHRDERRERAKHSEPERVREEERQRRERERDGEKRADRDEKEKRDKEKERQRDRYKDREREGDSARYKERDKERDRQKDGERGKERDRHRDQEDKDRVKEKDREKERHRDREGEKERERHRHREEKDRVERERERVKDREPEKERDREKRRTEREKERRKEKDRSVYVEEVGREKAREKRERHREREGEKSEYTDREDRRERRRREKEHYEAGETPHQHKDREGERTRDREGERTRDREGLRMRDTEGERTRDREGERTRDRQERDKHSEKRHEELKKSSSDQRHRKMEEKVENEVEDSKAAEEDYGNEDYEEDFEKMDYEEDFEEMEEDEVNGGEENEKEEREEQNELSLRRRAEVEAIRRAMQQENELVSSAHSQADQAQRVSADSESGLKKGRTHGRVIDFTAARQRQITQQASDRQKKRSAELSRLIELDFSVTECLLDLPPVSEYDMYIKSFGMANTKQAYVQCNEDNTDRDTQTEDTDSMDKWTQHPPESSAVCGGPRVSQDALSESVSRMDVDSKRLTAFLRSAAQVMTVLLEENRTDSNSVIKLQSQTDFLSFSDGCLQLNTKLSFLQDRQVTLLHFSQVQSRTLLSVHTPCSRSGGVGLESKTLICVWNIWEPSTPQRILTYEAEVRCCCFSPGKASLVFAGTPVGSVVLWDLREHSGSHSSVRVGGEDWTLRYPTFSTDAVLSGVGHFSAVVSVEPVLVNVEAGLRGPVLEDQEESLGLSFQLASLDENGLLNLWVVIELSKTDDSGSQSDLGLRPGGKVKLLHSSSIHTSDRLTSREVTPYLSLLLRFLPSDSNHFFIGTNMGVVRRGTRHRLRVVPKLYRPEGGEKPAEVTALDFCPSGEPFFLVGCSDGSVRLHSVLREEPVWEWTAGSGDVPVLSAQWSRTRPCVFCVLDASCVLHIWDLSKSESSPVITEKFQTDRLTALAVFGEAARQNRYSGLVLAKQSGRLEIHFLKEGLTVPQPTDSETLHRLAQENL